MSKQIDLKELLESKMDDLEPLQESQQVIERAETVIPKNLMYDLESTEFKPETKPVNTTIAKGLTVEEAKQFDDDMNRFIDTVLVAGVDYGVIPNCKKPTLLKSGAEKIMNYLGLIARTEVVNRLEDINNAFFSYECKVYLLDYNGVVKGEGIGLTNSRENKYYKQNGFSVQNVVLKMSKKRALVDAVLNVGNLSARFTQDVEDMNLDNEPPAKDNVEENKTYNNYSSTTRSYNTNNQKPASQRQLSFLEKLLDQHNITIDAVNNFTSQQYGISDYRMMNSYQASQLIEKIKKIS